MKAFLLVMSVCLICLCIIAGCKKLKNEETFKEDFPELERLMPTSGTPNDSSLINWEKVSALINAAGKGDPEEVKRLIKEGVDVNGVGWVRGRKETALVEATANGHTEIVKILIEAGADVNANMIIYTPIGRGDGPYGQYSVAREEKGPSVLQVALNKKNPRERDNMTDGELEKSRLEEKQLDEIIEILKAAGAKE